MKFLKKWAEVMVRARSAAILARSGHYQLATNLVNK